MNVSRRTFVGASMVGAGAAITAGLAGCGGGGNASGGSGSAAAGVVEVTIPSYKTGENVGAVFFEPQVERFNEKYDGQYHITLESVPEDGFKDRLKQLAQQNQLPVLVQGGDIDWQKNIAFPEGLAYDISGWLDENPDIKDILIPEGIEYCTTEDGAIYSMPLATVRPTGFYWNAQLWNPSEDLSKISMDEFLSLVGDQKIAFSTADNGWVCALFLTALINAQGGGDWLRSGVENQIVDFNTPEFIAAAGQLQQLLQNNAAPNSIGAAYADAENAFLSNQAAIISNGPWMSSSLDEANSENWSNGFDGKDAHASLWPGDMGIANTASYGEWWISSAASEQEVELAEAFLAFINSPEEIEAFLLAEGGSAPLLTYSDGFLEEQAEVQTLGELSADTTADTVFVPCILDMIPASVANSDFGRELPQLANGTYTPEQFAQVLTDAAAEASLE